MGEEDGARSDQRERRCWRRTAEYSLSPHWEKKHALMCGTA